MTEHTFDVAKRPPFIPVIVAADGTWHRPLTLLELAALQGYPARMNDAPIRFVGTRATKAEHIGNSIPPPAARPIGEQMLITLMQAEAEHFLALSGGQVWVDPLHEIGASA